MKAIEFPKCGSEAWKRAEIERMLDNDAYDRAQDAKKLMTTTAADQTKIDALVDDTRKHTALPSDACVIQSLATQVLLLRARCEMPLLGLHRRIAERIP